MTAVSTTLETVKYWAGQKLLHSPLHPLYLKISGKEPKPQTYAEWLLAERLGPQVPLEESRFRIVVEDGVEASPDAAYWLMRTAVETGAARVYADEDQIDSKGRRHSPVFRPQWSPILYRHCDYLGGCYLEAAAGTGYAHVPRVLFHRRQARVFVPDAVSVQVAVPATSVIVCSRDPRLLDPCLAGLAGIAELIAVIHLGQGQDEALRAVATRHGAVAVEFGGAFHFGRMCNLGARAAHGENLLFLNDDVTPLCDDWLVRMSSHFTQAANIGAVGALLLFPDGRIQHAGVMIGTPNGAGHPGRLSAGNPHWPWLTMTREVSAVTGACLLAPAAVFHKLGGFDEIFPVNYNDVDLCLRIRAAGFQIVLEAGARLEHAESATRKTGIRYGERRIFLDRWASLLAKGDPYFNPNLTDNELLLTDPEAHRRIETLHDRR